MGIFGKLFGSDKVRTAYNIIMADLIVKSADGTTLRRYLDAGIRVVARANKSSEPDAARLLNGQSRSIQLNIVAYGLNELGVQPPLKGYLWSHTGNPFMAAGFLGGDAMTMCINEIKKSTGVVCAPPVESDKLIF